MNQDRDAVGRLIEIVRSDEPAARRQAATALGQIGDASSAPALLDAATLSDRFLDHAAIYSLIGLRSAAVAQRALADSRPAARRAALIALDQMDGATLDRREAAALLSDRDPAVRGAALWVAAHHADWAPEILSKVRARLQSADWAEESDGLREILLTYSANPETQRFIAELLGSASEEQRGFALEVMDRSPVRDLPAAWVEKLVQIVEAQSGDLRVRALGIFRSRGIGGHDTLLTRLANDSSLPREERVLALSGLVTRRKALSRDEERFVIGLLDTAGDAALRQSGAQVLARATLSEDALNEIASKAIPAADALVLTHLLDAFAGARTQSVGLSLVRGLGKSDVVLGGSDAGKLEKILKAYPDAVRKAARPVLDRAAESERQRAEKLRELEPVLTAAGDVHAGRQVFFGEKTGCSGCHTIGKSGGDVGPDLTSIGAIRSGHDLLEAVVFPSATFVPGHEIYHVVTATETYAGVVRENEPGWVLVATGPREQIRVPRARVKSMRIAEVSIMPDGFDQVLSRKELGDLLAFLQSLKTPNQKPAQRAVFSRSR
jgi:putative heme-binding domain-containing protein